MRKSGRANIYDIAELAGVSIAMVSRVMNNSGPVAAAKRERVLEVLDAHDYRPSAAARSLARRDTNVFGVVVGSAGADYSQLFASRVIAGISEWCRGVHRNLMLLWCDTQAGPEQLIEEASRSVDGLLLLDVRHEPGWFAPLADSDVPVVFLNEFPPEGYEAAVVIDNRQGGRLAVEHLIGVGHRRIALLGGGQGLDVGRNRQAGAVAALETAGIDLSPAWRVDARFSPDRARRAVTELFADSAAGVPTGLFVASDLMAFAVLDELRQLGFRVPDDVSVVGFDNSLIAPLANPPLTSVEQPLVEMGRQGAALLDEILRDPAAARIVTLPVTLCERESVGGNRAGVAVQECD